MTAPDPAHMARAVVYGFLGALLLVALTGSEAWPLSSFRLFSDIRTEESTGWRLVAVTPAGVERPVDVRGDADSRRASRELHRLDDLPPANQRRRVITWLDLAHVDPRRYKSVRLYRVSIRATPDHRSTEEVGRLLEVDVPLA